MSPGTAVGHDGGVSEFDDATAVAADGTCAVHDGWDIGGNANGGYLLALAANGMRRLAGRPDPVTVTGHYLAPGRPGPAVVEGTVVKSGRRFATVTGSLQAGGAPVVQALATFGDLGLPASTFSHLDGAPPELPPFEACSPRPANGPVTVPLMERLDVRLHPDHLGFAAGAPRGVAEVAGWFAFADGRPVDTLALLLACDAFPPAVFHLDLPPGWVPTVELTVHVRAVPAPGPVRCVFRTRFVQGGFLDEEGEVWDSTDRLVAQSRQLGLMALG